MKLDETQLAALFNSLPQPAPDAVFSLAKLEYVAMPHPYCIGPRHVAEASNHFGGMLGESAIKAAEKRGATCCICKGEYTYSEHIRSSTRRNSVPSAARISFTFRLSSAAI